VLVIDDLANREHECDALLDQNLHADMEHRYRKLVPASCAQFLGPGHALLRDEFFAARKKAERKSRLRNVLVNFGGSDPTGETGKVLDALQQSGVPTGLCVHVVGGPANRRQVELRARCQSMPNVVFYPEMNRMADFLAGMDLAVGAGGVSLWERAFMGVPSAVIAVVDNQIPSAEEAARRDMIWYLGESRVVRPSQISELLRKLAEHPAELVRKSENSLLAMHTLRNVAKHPVIEYMLDECRKERSR
jgi:UDP-2,4-diacetamido-2,4,6-trideoxy-beta-L-altropyranose hydrolase